MTVVQLFQPGSDSSLRYERCTDIRLRDQGGIEFTYTDSRNTRWSITSTLRYIVSEVVNSA